GTEGDRFAPGRAGSLPFAHRRPGTAGRSRGPGPRRRAAGRRPAVRGVEARDRDRRRAVVTLLEGARRLVTRGGTDTAARVEALQEAVEAARGRLDEELVTDAETTLTRAA